MRKKEQKIKDKTHPFWHLRWWRGKKTTNPNRKSLHIPSCTWFCVVMQNWVSLELHLQARLPVTWGRFLYGLKLKSPHCVSCTEIHGCVLCGHRGQLQGEQVLGCIHCYGDLTLKGWVVVGAPTLIDSPCPLQSLTWGLVDPAPPVTTADGVSRDSTSKGQGFWGCHQAGSWLL
jgi:hypothetical protein